jgi:hypothetical protein
MAQKRIHNRKKLVKAVAESLAKGQVIFGSVPDASSLWGLIDVDGHLASDTLSALQQYTDTHAASTFILGTLSRELDIKYELSREANPRPLSVLPEYKDTDSLAERLVADLLALPRKYTVSFELPNSLKGIGAAELSSHFRFVTADKAVLDAFPFNPDRGAESSAESKPVLGILSGMFGEDGWRIGSIYLQIEIDGFVGTFAGELNKDATLSQAESNLRAVFGLGLALGLFYDSSQSQQPFAIFTKYLVHEQADRKWTKLGARPLPEWTSRILSTLVLKKNAEIAEFLNTIRIAISVPDRSPKLLLACQWLFDSYGSDDELLDFIRTTVVLEILLGEEEGRDPRDLEKPSLSELMANRCAYLIAKSHSERKKLLIEFKKIYKVRSGIVHKGKSRLAGDEKIMLRRLRELCHLVIREEIELLKADHDKRIRRIASALMGTEPA